MMLLIFIFEDSTIVLLLPIISIHVGMDFVVESVWIASYFSPEHNHVAERVAGPLQNPHRILKLYAINWILEIKRKKLTTSKKVKTLYT